MAADASGPEPSPDGRGGLTDAQKALRAQLLATEHWSLLASRSTTQGEVLTRIAIFLTLVSVGLLSLGVLGQATAFRGWFGAAALGILLLLLVLGVITLVRAFNTATEDLMYVVAMNRLRAAYVELDPGLAPFLMASVHDDATGIDHTYHFFYSRSSASVVFGSSMMIITVVTAAVAGLLGGATVAALSGPIWLAVALGVVVGIAVVLAALARGYRLYRRSLGSYRPISPSYSPGRHPG